MNIDDEYAPDAVAVAPTAALCRGCDKPLPPTKKGGRPRQWCSERCRKRMYDLECIVCGGRVDGTTPSTLRDPANPVCGRCAPAHYAKWSHDKIIALIRRWADEHDGVPPKASEWDPALARRLGHHERAEKFASDGCWPYTATVASYFGSWNAAITAAGYEPRRQGNYGRKGEDPAVVAETVRLITAFLPQQPDLR